jgi:hypothetical protein
MLFIYLIKVLKKNDALCMVDSDKIYYFELESYFLWRDYMEMLKL